MLGTIGNVVQLAGLAIAAGGLVVGGQEFVEDMIKQVKIDEMADIIAKATEKAAKIYEQEA